MATQRIRLAPRWIIFLIDLGCCVLAMSAAFLLRLNFNINEINHYPLPKILAITLAVNACLLIAFKTYAGIVRYTSVEDTGRILSVNTLVCLIFLLIENIYPKSVNTGSAALFPASVLLIYFLSINFLLIIYRLFVKRAFHYLFSVRKKSIKAVIYSAGFEGILAKKMITDNQRSDIKIISFIEDNERLIGKIIETTSVVRANKANMERLSREGVELLIIADPYIKKQRLNDLVDICLELNIRIQQVPSSEKWINNTLEPDQLKNVNIEQLLERDIIKIKNEQVGKEIRGKKVLVTGAAGSIGSEIVSQLLQYNPAIIIACDVAETPLHELSISLDHEAKVKTFIGDICDRIRMEQIFEIYAPDIVYHAAAYKHVPLMEEHPSAAILNNVSGTKILAELSVAYNVEKFVMVSTDKAVNPTNVMGASKRVCEIFIQSLYKNIAVTQHKSGNSKAQPRVTKFITTRFGNVLGSNGSVIPLFKKQLEEGGPLKVTHPEITRYFMTIPEACQLVLEAGAMGKGGEIFVFDMGSPVKIVDLAKKMIRLAGKEPERDIAIEFTGLRPGEKLYEELLNNAENTMPTYHEKILIANVREYDFATIHNDINNLIDLAQKHFLMETVIKIKEIVPEFISNNSIYQKLDIPPGK
ncbi:polysaccharide biosynthesis protein [Taibaiella lutea]|uniref:Polysaccharide biosynthesis protein n=1 Tax=Taibaiella lutea TaxID=2608001 RepID=A0A5M6CQI7_9BACT|nr:nucleoside-diphosphate sugar epimerase/dehydratase [Taibaiella lutea]KAA5537206.1 polysaccharide biosynthesis protein [Taibaiella lutea]